MRLPLPTRMQIGLAAADQPRWPIGSISVAGATLADVERPADFNYIEDVHLAISSFEFSRNFTWKIENHGTEISETLRNDRIRHGPACTFERYCQARDTAERCREVLPRHSVIAMCC